MNVHGNPAAERGLTVGLARGAGTVSRRPDNSDFAKALDAFRVEAKKSPVDRIRDQILKSHGLTEEALAALPPEQQSAIRTEIEHAVKQKIKTGVLAGGPAGASAPIVL